MDDRAQPGGSDRQPRTVLKFPTGPRLSEAASPSPVDTNPHAGAGAAGAAPPAPAALGEGGDVALRELMAVREIAHAFLTADRPQEVFQFALDRVSPVVG